MSCIGMSFSSITFIGLSRAQKVKRRLMSLYYNIHWTDMFLVGGGIASVLMPLATVVLLFYYGKKASIIFVFLQLLIITLLLFVSYGIIIHTVKKSHQERVVKKLFWTMIIRHTDNDFSCITQLVYFD